MVAEGIYEVSSWRTVDVRPSHRSCTCREWNVTCIPYRHARVVIRFMYQSVSSPGAPDPVM